MSERFKAEMWLDHLFDVDRTAGYLTAGGSLARVVTVPDDAAHAELRRVLERRAVEHGLRFLSVESPETMLHQPEHVLRDLVHCVDLGNVLAEFAASVWARIGYGGQGLSTLEVSEASGDSRIVLRRDFGRESRRVLGWEHALTRDFGEAFDWGATETVDGTGANAALLLGSWLAGKIGSKDRHVLGVHRPVNRANATSTIRSLMATSRLAGSVGTVLHVDARWMTDPELMPGTRGSTRQQRIWLYQWVRELIDSMPRWSSTFVCFEFGESFLDETVSGRGMGLYDALRIRIVDGVRPRGGQNPSAPLVSLS